MLYFYCLTDVPGVIDVVIEASEKDADSVGLSLTDDNILQIFPFSAVVPAVLEDRNKQKAAFIEEKSNLEFFLNNSTIYLPCVYDVSYYI